MKPYLVKAFTDSDNKTVKEFAPTEVRRVVSEQTSETMRAILESVVADGTGRNAYIAGYRVGGKTGTAQKYVDGKILQGKHISSFLAFAPANDPKILVLMVVDEPNVPVDFGSVVAAPYVKKVLEDSLKYMNVAPQYSERDKAPVKVKVPNLVGKTEAEAQTALGKLKLNYMTDGTGTIKDQTPAPDIEVDEKTIVLLYMQNQNPDNVEADRVTVPDLKNKSIKDAAALLKTLGLQLEISGSGLAGYQKPAAGEKVEKGSKVRVEFKNP